MGLVGISIGLPDYYYSKSGCIKNKNNNKLY